jgi:hypothetical protein
VLTHRPSRDTAARKGRIDMKNALQILAIVTSTLAPSTALADGEWIGADTIDGLLSYGDGVRLVDFMTTNASVNNPSNCGSTSHVMPNASLNAAAREELGRLLTSAFLAGRKIKVRLGACSSSGGNSFRTYTAIELK